LHVPFRNEPNYIVDADWQRAYNAIGRVYKLDINNVDMLPTDDVDGDPHFLSPNSVEGADGHDELVDLFRAVVNNYAAFCEPLRFNVYEDYDWQQSAAMITEAEVTAFKEQLSSTPPQAGQQVHSSTLNAEQRRVFDTVTSTVASGQQLLGIVQASAGCGKTYLINCFKTSLQDSMVACAFTGSAANLIAGHTISSLFSISFHSQNELSRRSLLDKQVRQCLLIVH